MIIFSTFRRFSLEMQVCLATLRPLKFFKRKKRKKESRPFKWKVSEKKFFLKKYYPIHHRKLGFVFSIKYLAKRYGWRFFLKPVGLELFFWIPGTYLCFLFLFIFFEITYLRLFVIGVESEEVVLIGILFWNQVVF